nr:LOW QUALITY PROTEIN: probable rhamnogalacturonate lyase B [Solanum lycopersicum]
MQKMLRYMVALLLFIVADCHPHNGYWDTVWSYTEPRTIFSKKFTGTSFEVIIHNENQTELSFKRKWNASQSNQLPLNIDKRFIMLRDTPGFYTYSIVERLKGWPISSIQNIRLVFRLQTDMFNYMVVSDERQRVMPTDVDRNNGKVLGYKEAVLLTDPTNPDLKGEVDDKYFYSNDDKDGKVYGWISTTNPLLGFWMINPSNEYRIGGPLKQDLTTHVGPTVLTVFCSTHYAGEDLAIKFEQGESWKKVLGPVFVYLNSNAAAKANPSILWNDAKKRLQVWPYEFALSKDYIKSNQRGTVRGQLFVNDGFISKQNVAASNAYVGLSPPGEAGSWQTENKGYQFWTKTDGKGNFIIENVIFGTYNLYATVPGFIGDYKYTSNIKVTPGSNIKLGTLIYKPPRNGDTIWEIGIPDRSAAEFFIPNPPSQFKVHKYKNNSETKFRQYGLWEQYGVLYPKNDLVYNVGTSNYSKDWFYAQVTRKIGINTYNGTTWKIIFNLANVNIASNYTIQLALAAAEEADLHVLIINDEKLQEPHFSTGNIGGSNAIARHGIHGLYFLYSIGIQGKLLVNGANTIFLIQSSGLSPFEGIMYDYIRLEGPNQ